MPERTQARLLVADKSQPDFLFTLNPSKVTRTRAPAYADIPIARGDSWATTATPQMQWTRNPPEDIGIDFVLYNGNQDADDVERELDHLDALMARSSRSGEPSDLVFIFGRADRVRITGKTVDEAFRRPDGRVAKATVQLRMRTLRARGKGA